MTHTDLKPCPKCGSCNVGVLLADVADRTVYAVSCRVLHCEGVSFTLGSGFFPTREEAITAWNTRARTPDAAPSQSADLIAEAEAHAEWLATHDAFETEDFIRHLIIALRATEAEVVRLRGLLAKPPKHNYWGAGEPDCPREIKAGNGELHTLRCKVCGLDNPRDEICRALGGEHE